MIRRIWFAPGEWICAHTNAEQRRAANAWLLIVWLTVGAVVWFLLRNVIWFLGFMSIYAIWTGHLGALSAETPVETEDE